MSVMDKFLNAMKLNDEDDEYYDDYYDDEPEPVKKPGPGREREREREEIQEEERIIRKPSPKVTPMRQDARHRHGGMRDQTHYRGGCQRDHGDASGQQDGGSQP